MNPPSAVEGKEWLARRLEGMTRDMCGLFEGDSKKPLLKSKHLGQLQVVASAHNKSLRSRTDLGNETLPAQTNVVHEETGNDLWIELHLCFWSGDYCRQAAIVHWPKNQPVQYLNPNSQLIRVRKVVETSPAA